MRCPSLARLLAYETGLGKTRNFRFGIRNKNLDYITQRLYVVIQRYFLRLYVVENYFSIVCLENADLSCYHANVNTPLYKAVLSTASRVHSGRANHFSSIAREFDMLTRVHVLHYHEVYSKRPVHNRRKIHVERCSQYRQNNYEAVSAAQNIQVRLVEIAFSPC